MSILGEQPEHGDSKTTIMCQEDTSARIHNLLQNFDVLTSRIERHNFKYAYLFFIFFYLTDVLQILVSSKVVKEDIVHSRYLLFVVVGISLILWTFRAWQRLIPKTLEYLLDKRRIFVTAGEVNICYLHLLEEYRDALRKPLRYLLISSLLIIIVFYYIYAIFLPSIHDTNSYDITYRIFRYIHLLLIALIQFGTIYYVGIVVWTLCISGRYISKLIQTLEIRIEPLHPDECGGLRVLGNFCFRLAAPIFVGSAFFTGYIFFVALRDPSNIFSEATSGLILFVILVYGLPTAIFAFFFPVMEYPYKNAS